MLSVLNRQSRSVKRLRSGKYGVKARPDSAVSVPDTFHRRRSLAVELSTVMSMNSAAEFAGDCMRPRRDRIIIAMIESDGRSG